MKRNSITTAILILALFATPANAQHTVALSWTASSTSGVTYNLYRQQACSGNFVQINASAVTTTTYTDSAVAPGETYCFQVTATSTGGESTPSNPAPATIPGAAAQPSNSQSIAKATCSHRGTFIGWVKCVASLPHKGK